MRFYVDDFGTGYSSLTYLHRFQPDGLKIDRSFLAGIPADLGRTEITTAVLGMARSLRLTAVAEGVENEEQLRWLQDKGCESAQGYLFAAPLLPDEFEARYGADALNIGPLVRVGSGGE
jgi:EAL domain-containing protein (putative c-di-GMP-specific phosphodiesterase class I)